MYTLLLVKAVLGIWCVSVCLHFSPELGMTYQFTARLLEVCSGRLASGMPKAEWRGPCFISCPEFIRLVTLCLS